MSQRKRQIHESKTSDFCLDSKIDSNLYRKCGVILQYGSSKRGIRPLREPPVNPRGRNILSTIKALREAGYETTLIRVNPGPPDREGTDIITEEQLINNLDLEYLNFALVFGDNKNGVQYFKLGRLCSEEGQRKNIQLGYEVGYYKTDYSNGEMQRLEEIVQKNAFDHKDIEFGPVDFDKLPTNGYPFVR